MFSEVLAQEFQHFFQHAIKTSFAQSTPFKDARVVLSFKAGKYLKVKHGSCVQTNQADTLPSKLNEKAVCS
jgi:hypothetical protein